MIYLLSAALGLELSALVLQQRLLSVLSAGCFLVFFIYHWHSLMPYPRKLAWVSLAVLLYWAGTAQVRLEQLLSFASAVAYYSVFVGSLGLMHALVKHLPVLSELHQKLLNGPKATLYPAYLLTSFAISAVISFGMLSLVCGSLEQHTQKHKITGKRFKEGVRGIMTSALRGWALVPLLAPTSVGVAILTREIPSLTWSTLLPYSAIAALVMLAVGWWQENRRIALFKRAKTSVAENTSGLSFNQLLAASLMVISLIALIANLTWLSATQSAMVLIPLTVLASLRLLTGSFKQSFKEVNDTLCGMRNESFIFGCSALLGALIGVLTPVEFLASLLGTSTFALFAFASGAMLLIVISTLLGVSPIIGISLCAGVLAQLSTLGIAPLAPAIALLCGFSLAMLISPYGASALMLARYSGLTPWRVAVTWNGPFVLWIVVPMLLIPLLA